jgi:hyperosmotically inducible protein
MNRTLFLLAAVAVLAVACNRPDAGAQSVEEERLAERADDERKAKPLPDASLTSIVKSALVSDTSLDANKIDVENKAGNVALYGSVETARQKEKAERIVMSVGGVRSVANNLSVREPARDESAGSGATGK